MEKLRPWRVFEPEEPLVLPLPRALCRGQEPPEERIVGRWVTVMAPTAVEAVEIIARRVRLATAGDGQ